MIPGAPIHRCTTEDCPYLGQPTFRGCGCHKTSEQLLLEQCDELLAVLKALAKEHHDILASGDCGCTDPAKCDELIAANATIAKVEGRS